MRLHRSSGLLIFPLHAEGATAALQPDMLTSYGDPPMRLQVMHLPAPADEFPYVLVIDQCEDVDSLGNLIAPETKAAIGARGILVFEGEVEVA